MKPLLIAFMLTAPALPLAAQEDDRPVTERGLRLFLDGLIEDMEPALRDLEGLAQDATPFMEEMQRSLSDIIDDFDVYDVPEVLPNGDILIRRKTPLTPDLPGPDLRDPDMPEIVPNADGSFDL